MALNVKAVEWLLKFDKEAALRSGVSQGVMQDWSPFERKGRVRKKQAGTDCGVRLNDIYLILFSSFAGSRLMSHISTTWMVSDDSE